MNLNVNSNLPLNFNKNDEAQSVYPKIFFLLSEIVKSAEHNIEENVNAECSISKTAKSIMIQLYKKDGVTQLEIGRSSHLKAPTISLALQKLESEGFVTKMPDRYDLRSIRVFITDKGRDFTQFYIDKMLEEEKQGLYGISERDRKQLLSLLHKINDNLTEF